MDLRVLKYFLAVAREQNFTAAAESLHITQPTLSRQIAALEAELGTSLLDRSGKRITLTEKGLLLKRRALEMVDLEEKAFQEITSTEAELEGTIGIGCGEISSVRTLARICAAFRKDHPKVRFAVHTATADSVMGDMQKGILDFGLLVMPVDTTDYDYVRMSEPERWVVLVDVSDPFACKKSVSRKDLLERALCLPDRIGVQSELANWFGSDFKDLDIAFTGNMTTNSVLVALESNACVITLEGAVPFWDTQKIVSIPLEPQLEAASIIAWRRDVPFGPAAESFATMLKGYAL